MVESEMQVFGVRNGAEFVVTAGNWNRAGEFESTTTIDLTEGVTWEAIDTFMGHVIQHGTWAESSSLHHGEIAERWDALVSKVSTLLHNAGLVQ
ncbi:MAG: hypothetical protein VXX11_03530 [Planctomycetota bacterium]|nr:hypothetical protein [Planctomycetota bacterium]